LLDIHEEPFSNAARQWLAAAPSTLPIVMYTAQNIDKRLPPPFFGYERRAHKRVSAFYPCSRQAAAVTRGKGFRGQIDVIPLGYDAALFRPGEQKLDDAEVVLGLFGRLVPEKGVLDAVRVLAGVNEVRPARLWLVGSGPEEGSALQLAQALGINGRVVPKGERSGPDLAQLYREAHFALVPSRTTATWVEQFGRIIVEAQASGAVVAGYSSGAIGEVAGAAGALAPEGDVTALASRVTDLLTRPDEYGRRRTEGLRSARSRTWAEVGRRQAALYESVLNRGIAPVAPLASPKARRLAAQREFGPTAAAKAGVRPFALPLLRRGGPVATSLAKSIDGTVEIGRQVIRRWSYAPGRQK
jgi:glycosyltransferase involved in cell wall biosynthesis